MSAPGWNDPPQFSHGSLHSQGVKKSKLSKRPAQAPPPPGHPSPLTTTSTPHNPPPLSNVQSPSPDVTILPPPTTTTSPAEAAEVGTDREEGSGVTSTATDSDVVDYSGVLEGLQSQLERFQSSMSRREVEDVGKRLEAMRRQWEEEETLSTHVRTEMARLLRALEAGDTAAAQRIQVALMVDHTAEVSLWMMGVKRLIVRAEKATKT